MSEAMPRPKACQWVETEAARHGGRSIAAAAPLEVSKTQVLRAGTGANADSHLCAECAYAAQPGCHPTLVYEHNRFRRKPLEAFFLVLSKMSSELQPS